MGPTKICFHPSMFMSVRKRPALRQAAGVAVVVAILGLVAWSLVQLRSSHRGEHYVPGAAGQQGSVSLWPGYFESQNSPAVPQADISDSCFYDGEGGPVFVPIYVRARGKGAMTFHVTATIARDGVDGGGVVKSVVIDVPFLGATGGEGTWVRIPLDHATWNGGATHCRVRSTMTPGAWFFNDD